MDYNKNYINTFSDKEYFALLNDKDRLKKIGKDWIERAMYSKEIECTNILLKESLDHWIVMKLQENEAFLYSSEMKNYVIYINEICNKSSIEYTTNIIFSNDNSREKYLTFWQQSGQKEIKEIHNTEKNKRITIWKKIMRNEIITQQELDYISQYFAQKRSVTNFDVFIKYIFSKQFEESVLKINYFELEAIMAFMPFSYGEGLENNVRIVLGNTDKHKKMSSPGHSSNSNYVAVNKEKVKNISFDSISDSRFERLKMGKDFSFLMVFLNHELTHQIQNQKSKLSYFDNQGFGKIKKFIFWSESYKAAEEYIRNNNITDETEKNKIRRELNYYKVNHDNEDIEINANFIGWDKSGTFFYNYYNGVYREELIRNCLINKNSSRTRKLFSFLLNKKSDRGNISDYGNFKLDYEPERLAQILKSNPQYIEKIPMLKIFFNEDGTVRRNFLYDLNMTNFDSANDFIYYYINNFGIEKLIDDVLNNKLSMDKLSTLVTNIFSYINTLINSYKKINYIINHGNIGEYNNGNVGEFNIEFATKIAKINFEKGLKLLQITIPLFQVISQKYPSHYANWIKNEYNYINDSINKYYQNKDYDIGHKSR